MRVHLKRQKNIYIRKDSCVVLPTSCVKEIHSTELYNPFYEIHFD